jgi:integrase
MRSAATSTRHDARILAFAAANSPSVSAPARAGLQVARARLHHYLLQRRKGNGARMTTDPEKPMGGHGLHSWWYRALGRAGIVPEGVESRERMHKARHTAGQRLLDHMQNLNAVQQLLGHSSIATTGDIYVGWDEAALAASLQSALEAERESE